MKEQGFPLVKKFIPLSVFFAVSICLSNEASLAGSSLGSLGTVV